MTTPRAVNSADVVRRHPRTPVTRDNIWTFLARLRGPGNPVAGGTGSPGMIELFDGTTVGIVLGRNIGK